MAGRAMEMNSMSVVEKSLVAVSIGTGVPADLVVHLKMNFLQAGEENLLCLPRDKYTGENILIHEFAHLIDFIGLRGTDRNFSIS